MRLNGRVFQPDRLKMVNQLTPERLLLLKLKLYEKPPSFCDIAFIKYWGRR